MKAVKNRILIDPTPVETVTKSGIILTPKPDEKSTYGTVVSIGKEVKEVKIGDVVHFNKYVGVELTLNEKKYLTIREEEAYIVE